MEILEKPVFGELLDSSPEPDALELLLSPETLSPETLSPETLPLAVTGTGAEAGEEGESPAEATLMPARMVNEYAYCPRLYYLMHVQQEWAHSVDTLDGRLVHRRVDRPEGKAPAADALEDTDRLHARSIPVGSTTLGAIAVVDVLESDGTLVTPVDYKRSKAPDIPERSWEPERVQVCLQALLLRDNGYTCHEAVLYYAGNKTRVTVPLTAALISRTLVLLAEAKAMAHAERIPPPLVDSPKCPRCSLVGICLPDEVNLLRAWPPGERAFQIEVEVDDVPSTPAPHVPSPQGSPTELDEDIPDPQGLAGWTPPAWIEGVLPGQGPNSAPLGVPTASGEALPGLFRRLEPRRLLPARSDKVPLYVQGQGFSLGLSGDILEVREKGKKVDSIRLMELSHVALFGNVQLSAQALRELMAREIQVAHLSYGGWIHAITTPMTHKNILLRQRQFAVAADDAACLALAKAFVMGKVKNARTLVRRNGREVPEQVLRELSLVRRDILRAENLATLLGVEGNAARAYFSVFSSMFKAESKGGEAPSFDFNGRNRRPPKDPVNALLSFVYALLTKELVATSVAIGLDPFLGFYHQPRYGRPALALDLMEEFRPLIGDSVVIGLINNGELGQNDFLMRAGACMLTDSGRKRVIEAFERRMDQLVSHPLFGYSLSYRRVFEVQVRLLSRHLQGELPTYEPFCTR